MYDNTKSSKVKKTHDIDSYLISAGPDELPPWGSSSGSAISRQIYVDVLFQCLIPQKVQKSIQRIIYILIWLVLAQMSYLPEAAYLGLHFLDKYMLMFDFNVWYPKKFRSQYNWWPRFLFD